MKVTGQRSVGPCRFCGFKISRLPEFLSVQQCTYRLFSLAKLWLRLDDYEARAGGELQPARLGMFFFELRANYFDGTMEHSGLLLTMSQSTRYSVIGSISPLPGMPKISMTHFASWSHMLTVAKTLYSSVMAEK